MADTLRNLVAVAGIYISGDLGPYTIYTNRRRRKVVYDRSPPDKPPSALQILQRQRFATVAADWNAISAPNRVKWEQCTLRTGIPMTGYNLFTFAETATGSNPYLVTIFTQAQLMPVPPYTLR